MFSKKATKIDEIFTVDLTLGAVHKLRLQQGVGGQKNQFFVNFHAIENVNRGG